MPREFPSEEGGGEATVNGQHLTGDETGGLGGEKQRGGSDIPSFAQPAQWCPTNSRSNRVLRQHGDNAFGGDGRRRDSVHANTVRPQFDSAGARQPSYS